MSKPTWAILIVVALIGMLSLAARGRPRGAGERAGHRRGGRGRRWRGGEEARRRARP